MAGRTMREHNEAIARDLSPFCGFQARLLYGTTETSR